jgi:hypothetical protein
VCWKENTVSTAMQALKRHQQTLSALIGALILAGVVIEAITDAFDRQKELSQ